MVDIPVHHIKQINDHIAIKHLFHQIICLFCTLKKALLGSNCLVDLEALYHKLCMLKNLPPLSSVSLWGELLPSLGQWNECEHALCKPFQPISPYTALLSFMLAFYKVCYCLCLLEQQIMEVSIVIECLIHEYSNTYASCGHKTTKSIKLEPPPPSGNYLAPARGQRAIFSIATVRDMAKKAKTSVSLCSLIAAKMHCVVR